MPKPVDAAQRYMPGLDGLRALAVLAVIAYHVQLGFAPGGLLGVGVFFTLSGFLITSLLIGQWQADGRLRLGDFWIRRARRLLPALFVMLAVVTAWVTVADRARLADLRKAVWAACAYISNWYLIAAHQSYFAQFAPPAPLDHLWSLAVEEQFYLLWPLLLFGGLLMLRRAGALAMKWLALAAIVAAAASALTMVYLYVPGLDATRVYEGTDTRAFGLLIGAALALAWPAERLRAPGRVTRIGLEAGGAAGLVIIAWMVWKVGQYSPFSYRGGMVLLSVATAAVVAATACPVSWVGLALGWRPLRWIGARSYGIYLWHYPVIVLTTPANAQLSLARAALQVAAAITLAALSWRFVEEPIRHGALGRSASRLQGWFTQARDGGVAAMSGMSRSGPVRVVGAAGAVAWVGAAAGSVAVLTLAVAGMSGAVPAGASEGAASALVAGAQALPGSPRTGAGANGAGGAGAKGAGGAGSGKAADGGPRTSCTGVVHIGDSTSYGLDSPLYIPDPAKRITARYHAVGVRKVITEISGGRSIVEVLPGQVNAYDTAKQLIGSGYSGCWVLALGTDDTANVAAGSSVGLMDRITKMMAVTKGEPVLWVNVKTLVSGGPYAEPNMEQWNAAILKACARYPNLRIYDWASAVHDGWFVADGIHYTPLGYQTRAQLIATALARAFPATGGPSRGCVVSG